ncbi:MAG: hypothetical protein JXA67_12965 [Micromonosporaceae bacterium]|nr:hypothetical protein [Micromonosporaceae bacterium]
MARVVVVHGINNTYNGPHQMAASWVPALRDGLQLAGHDRRLAADEITCVSYGDVFRTSGRFLGDGDLPWLEAEDVEDGYERELLGAWWRAASGVDPGVIAPDARTLGASAMVQSALAALSCSRFLAGVSERLLIFWLKQVHRYFTDDDLRGEVQGRLVAGIGADTRVVVAHSLGSVVAYEALCAHPRWPVTTLVTLGSPLGIRNLIFDRLRPSPVPDGDTLVGVWPAGLRHWTNINDAGDFVALVECLRTRFGPRVVDVGIDNGVRAHQVERYLSAAETGAAVAAGLVTTDG